MAEDINTQSTVTTPLTVEGYLLLTAEQVRALLAGNSHCREPGDLTHDEHVLWSELMGFAQRAPELAKGQPWDTDRQRLIRELLRDLDRAKPAKYAGTPPEEWWKTAGRLEWAAAIVDAGWRRP